MNYANPVLILSLALTGGSAFAEGKVKEAAKEVTASVKEGVRDLKDAACPIVDGKVKCAAKKAKHKAENAADELKK